jgi:putative transposase
VSPRTSARWVSGETKSVGKKAKTGRRRTEEELCNLVVTIARDLGAGYTRVMGELKKLGIKPPSRNTVKKILKAEWLDPGPKRGVGTWDEFLKLHAATLWQMRLPLGADADLQGASGLVLARVPARRIPARVRVAGHGASE